MQFWSKLHLQNCSYLFGFLKKGLFRSGALYVQCCSFFLRGCVLQKQLSNWWSVIQSYPLELIAIVAFFIPQIDSLEVLFVKEERRLYRRKRDSLLFLFWHPFLVGWFGSLIFRRIERDEPFFTDNQKFSFMQKSFLRGNDEN